MIGIIGALWNALGALAVLIFVGAGMLSPIAYWYGDTDWKMTIICAFIFWGIPAVCFVMFKVKEHNDNVSHVARVQAAKAAVSRREAEDKVAKKAKKARKKAARMSANQEPPRQLNLDEYIEAINNSSIPADPPIVD